jgi:hypothetical protein
MNRRLGLIALLFIVPIMLLAMAVWYHHTRSSITARLANAGINSAQLSELGLVKGITPQGFRDATSILVQERRMWSRFNGVSGDINVEFQGNDGKLLSLEGRVKLRRLDLSPDEKAKFLAKYEMTISDREGGWRVTTDGTSKNTVITCQNPQMLETIQTIGPASLLHLLTFPQYLTAMLYRDELYPPNLVNPFTLDQFVNSFDPWLTTNAAPHSYTFFDMGGARRIAHNEITFQNGHINRWRRTETTPAEPGVEKLAVYFENPMESNGFWYPTVIRITPAPTPWPYPQMEEGWFAPIVPPYPAGNGQLRIILSDISVSVK